MIRKVITTTAITASTTAAFADPGHLADHRHGHTHWLGYALLALAVAIPAGIAVAKRVRKAVRV
jgi:hypothetical protein